MSEKFLLNVLFFVRQYCGNDLRRREPLQEGSLFVQSLQTVTQCRYNYSPTKMYHPMAKKINSRRPMFRRETRKPFLKVCSSFGFVLGIFVRKYQAFRREFGIPFCTVETKSHVINTGKLFDSLSKNAILNVSRSFEK